jgi:AsmA protein
VRRADFVPDRTIAVDLECQAKATEAFHAFQDVRCSWPPAGESDKGSIALTASLPNIRRPDSLEVEVGAQALPNQRVIDWLQATSSRVPADVAAEGTLAGQFTYQPQSSNAGWDGKLLITGLSLKSQHAGLQPLTIGDLALQSGSPQPDSAQSGSLQLTSLHVNSRHSKPAPSTHTFLLEPTTLDLGGEDPATLDGTFDRSGYTLHLTGMIVLSRLTALGNTIPQLGDGLKEVLPTNRAAGPVRLDLTATRPWGGPQTWQDNTLHPAPTHPHHRTR